MKVKENKESQSQQARGYSLSPKLENKHSKLRSIKPNLSNKSFFLMQFGDTPQLRVLDFLIGFHFFDYPITEIARESNVSYNSLKVFFPYFIKSGIVCKTRKIGKSDYFKLNLENIFVKNLLNCY